MPPPLLVFAHRGASGHAPENTLAAIDAAIAMKADWIEIDVYAVEGRLVVIHDERVDRTTNGSGYVVDHSLAELRRLDAGRGERIPFLEEVIERIGGRCGLNVELKGTGTAELAARVLTSADRGGTLTADRALVSSFDHRELRRFRNAAPGIAVGALIGGVPEDLAACGERLGAAALHPSLDFLPAELVADARRRGLRVYTYTANHPDDIARAIALGVDGIFSDYPERVVAGLNRHNSMNFP